MKKITLKVDTAQLPAITGMLQGQGIVAKVPWWKRIFARHKRSWKWHKRPEDIPPPDPIIEPLSWEQVRERSAYGVASRKTQNLKPLPNTEAIDLSSIEALR